VTSIALVGCGRWGRLVLRDLLALQAEVTVVATGDNAHVAAEAGARVVARAGDLPRVDGIVVVTPTSTHADVIESILPRGVPIFCEKPLCDDPRRARRLASAGGDRLFVMDKWRYHCGVRELAAIAHSGELGAVVGLRTLRIGYGQAYRDTDCVWTLLPHDLAIAAEILGGVLTPRHAVADFANGEPMGLFAVSANDPGPWHVVELSIRSPKRKRAIKLLCADGVAILEDAYADHIVLVNNPSTKATSEPTVRRPIACEMPLRVELAAFFDHLKGGPPPKSSAAEAAEAVVTIAEIRRLAGL
jgi:predicted dehydrogenase